MIGTNVIRALTLKNLSVFILSFLLFACSKIDQQTAEKIEYWDKQAEIMTLIGPDKSSVFEWVYAIDKNAVYKGESLHAILETLHTSATPKRCIKLTIKFDERERVREHIVFLDEKCAID
tara:strand:+ start:12428 stop:12787 length:360 start_codon:yes stop_codon:yes gene_type:complete